MKCRTSGLTDSQMCSAVKPFIDEEDHDENQVHSWLGIDIFSADIYYRLNFRLC